MPAGRIRGTSNIKPWDLERLLRDMAVGDKSDAELAAEYDKAEQTIWVIRMNHKAEIAALVTGMVDDISHIWSTRLGNHVRILTQRWERIIGQLMLLEEHAERETETIRSVDREAAEVRTTVASTWPTQRKSGRCRTRSWR
jgi:hypothetical protein